MKTIAALAVLGFAAATPMGEYEHDFLRFIAKENKMYGTKEEYNFRLGIFSKNAQFIEEFNKTGKHTVGINHLADWTEAEKKQLLGAKVTPESQKTFGDFSNVTIPASVDWNKAGAVTAIKDQGRCGSCWTFSSTGALEGLHWQNTGVLTSFSEQNLVDCCNNGVGGCYQSQGCGGGFMTEGLTYSTHFDLETEADYPYTGQDGTCTYTSGAGWKNVGYHHVKTGDAAAMHAAIATGPVSLSIEADQAAYQFYTSGVISSGCGDALDHGVLGVGYGHEDGQDYVLVKNSWGPGWGDHGFVKLSFNTNACGFLNDASQPYGSN